MISRPTSKPYQIPYDEVVKIFYKTPVNRIPEPEEKLPLVSESKAPIEKAETPVLRPSSTGSYDISLLQLKRSYFSLFSEKKSFLPSSPSGKESENASPLASRSSSALVSKTESMVRTFEASLGLIEPAPSTKYVETKTVDLIELKEEATALTAFLRFLINRMKFNSFYNGTQLEEIALTSVMSKAFHIGNCGEQARTLFFQILLGGHFKRSLELNEIHGESKYGHHLFVTADASEDRDMNNLSTWMDATALCTWGGIFLTGPSLTETTLTSFAMMGGITADPKIICAYRRTAALSAEECDALIHFLTNCKTQLTSLSLADIIKRCPFPEQKFYLDKLNCMQLAAEIGENIDAAIFNLTDLQHTKSPFLPRETSAVKAETPYLTYPGSFYTERPHNFFTKTSLQLKLILSDLTLFHGDSLCSPKKVNPDLLGLVEMEYEEANQKVNPKEFVLRTSKQSRARNLAFFLTYKKPGETVCEHVPYTLPANTRIEDVISEVAKSTHQLGLQFADCRPTSVSARPTGSV